ncbi:MAG: hypothetical protein FD180_221 [Planctomycetota bacterium]|nr:MAG: hypothetical protein FD180_221 [Planctomycetota bacterium]
MRIRSVLTLLALALTAGSSMADTFWFTKQGIAPGVHPYDSATNTIGASITIPAADPRVAATYGFGAPYGIDSLFFSSSEGPILAYIDNPYCVVVDILPGSPTYASVIQTIDMRDTSIIGDNPNLQFCKIHPLSTRIYTTGIGSATSQASVRIARQSIGLPAATLTYTFTPITNPADRLTMSGPIPGDLAGEWGSMLSPPFTTVVDGAITPWAIDICPDLSKVYFTSHQEGFIGPTPVNLSNVHGFTIDGLGDYVSNLTVTELPSAEFNHCHYLAFSPSTLPYDSGGTRCYVSNNGIPDIPGIMPPPSPGFVMVISWLADATTLGVEAGLIPPPLDPATPLTPLVPAFFFPIGIDWAAFSTTAFVSDIDLSVAPPATDGIIGVKVFTSITPAGSPTVSDKSFLYFADNTPLDDVDPQHYGVAVDNDDSEVVFCNLGSLTSPPTINYYGIDGILVSFATVTGGQPVYITCQSGTGMGGPPGGGGGGGAGGGGTAYNDNGAGLNENSSRKKHRCGLTGMEAPLLLGLWLLVRRRSKKSSK